MKRRKMIITVGLILVVAIVITLIPTIKNSSEETIVKKTLEVALINQEIPDYNLIKDKVVIVLSTENIHSTIAPTIPGFNLVMLSPNEIHEKANKEGDFLYLRFKSMNIGILKSSVSLDNSWIITKTSDKAYLSGGGFTLDFYNVLGTWIDRGVRQSWIS